jgi:cytochrome P450
MSGAAQEPGDERPEAESAAEGEPDPAELPTPPGPDGLPVLGNVVSLSRDPRGFYDEMATHGDVVSYGVPRLEFVALLHPDQIQRVLLTDHDRFEKYGFEEFGGEFASEGLLLSEGEQWHRQRTAVQNAFTLDRIESYADAMVRYTEEMVDDWDDGAEVALNRAFSRLTLRILGHTLFDVDLDERAEVVDRFARVVNERGEVRNLSTFLPMWVPTPGNRRYNRTLAAFREFVEGLIDERRGRAEEYDDLLSIMLTAEDDEGRGMSEVEVRDQMTTFLFAGHETTALALTYAFLEIAKREDVSDRLDAEHADVLGGEPPGVRDVPELDATDRVVDETLRLYPPAYIFFREAAEDVRLGGYRIPAGTKLSLPPFYVHTDDRWYDDPHEFRPQRWAGDLNERVPDYAYFPFGGGPRHCIGMRFATMELKSVIPTVAQRVDLELLSDPDPSFAWGTTLRPSGDVRVRVHER